MKMTRGLDDSMARGAVWLRAALTVVLALLAATTGALIARDRATPISIPTSSISLRLTDHAGELSAGAPVYSDAPQAFRAAAASSPATASVIGLVTGRVDSGEQSSIVTAGPLEEPLEQWDLVAGTTGGLATGTRYYLSSESGRLTSKPPSERGAMVEEIGIAYSSTGLLINIKTPVRL